MAITFASQYNFYFQTGFDLENKDNSITQDYGLFYSPSNNCWKLNIKFQKHPLKKGYRLTFLSITTIKVLKTSTGSDNRVSHPLYGECEVLNDYFLILKVGYSRIHSVFFYPYLL